MTDQVLPPPGPDSAGPVFAPAPPAGDPWRLLFTGGPRLGWVFRDRRELVPVYPEPKPGPEAVQSLAAGRVAAAEARFQRAWKWIGRPSIGVALLLVVLAACAKGTGGGGFSAVLALVTIVVICAPGLAYTGWCWLERDKARDIPPEQEYRQAVAEWEQRAAGHADTELTRLAGQPEWGSVNIAPKRTDIYGGTLTGWEALVAVHGASLLSARPLLIADLTGQNPADPLLSLARDAGKKTVTWRLPEHLGRSGILGDLPPDQLAAAIAEALHAGAPGGARTERAHDTRLLRDIAEVLAPGGTTMPRLAAAVRAALGHRPDRVLSPEEGDRITGTLFPPGGAREQAAAGLSRLNSVLPDLAARSGEGWPGSPAYCTCLTIGTAPRSAGSEVLVTLVIQWLTHQAATLTGDLPAIIIAGADQVTVPHAEALADACEASGIPLTLLFRHLRDDAASLLGGAATTAFMRMGNHREAEQAATYLGRRHTYQMSSFTATRGGSTTSTAGGSKGHSTGDTTSDTKNRGWQGAMLAGERSRSGGKSRTTGTSTSESESETWSAADGTNWSDAKGIQRVYEFRVEPTVLQDLPEQALLLADRSQGALRLRAVECDPDIVTLPNVSATPLPPPPALTQGGRPPAVTGPIPKTPGHDPASAWRPDSNRPN